MSLKNKTKAQLIEMIESQQNAEPATNQKSDIDVNRTVAKALTERGAKFADGVRHGLLLAGIK